ICEERPAVVRGLCRRCRQGTRRAVAARMTTEQALIDHGMLLPRQPGPFPQRPVKWRRRLEELKLIKRRLSCPPESQPIRRPNS
ncbi:MAG: hypothetical protein AB7O26_12890, partial [Planctomycetaceae bacterium]